MKTLTWLDRLLQSWRIWMVARFIPKNAVVADIGSWDASLFTTLKSKHLTGYSIDPLLDQNQKVEGVQFLTGLFPADVILPPQSVDVVALLAVMEHIPKADQHSFAEACFKALKPGGKVVMTIPSPAVDGILSMMKKLRLIKGMETGQHFGLEPEYTRGIFINTGFKPLYRATFQAGLNHLFVFKKP